MNGKMTNNNHLIQDVPFHPGPVCRPLPKPTKQDVSYPLSSQSSTDIENIYLNFDFEENCISGGHHVQDISETGQIIF